MLEQPSLLGVSEHGPTASGTGEASGYTPLEQPSPAERARRAVTRRSSSRVYSASVSMAQRPAERARRAVDRSSSRVYSASVSMAQRPAERARRAVTRRSSSRVYSAGPRAIANGEGNLLAGDLSETSKPNGVHAEAKRPQDPVASNDDTERPKGAVARVGEVSGYMRA